MPLRFNCPSCGKDIILQYIAYGEKARCRHCGAQATVPDDAEVLTVEQAVEYARQNAPDFPDRTTIQQNTPIMPANSSPRGKIGFLKVAAWILMIIGSLFGLMSFIGGIAMIGSGNSEEGSGSTVMVMGIAIIIQAIVSGAFLLGMAVIAESVTAIQKKLEITHPEKV